MQLDGWKVHTMDEKIARRMLLLLVSLIVGFETSLCHYFYRKEEVRLGFLICLSGEGIIHFKDRCYLQTRYTLISFG